MFVRWSILSAAAWLVASGVIAPEAAKAGYVSATDSAAVALLNSSDSTGAGPVGNESDGRELGWLPQSPFERVIGNAPADTGTQQPTSSSQSSVASACPLAADDELSANAQIEQRIGVAGKVWLPPAFLSGIFRPPRFVG
jgi:hypothetical protein